MPFISITPGYTWTDGEVVTATKLNLAASPTVAPGGTYTFENGTAAVPSISFTSDGDTGFYNSSANTLGGACGGASVWQANTTTFTFGYSSGVTVTSAGINGVIGGTTPNTGIFGAASSSIAFRTVSTNAGDRLRVTPLASGSGVSIDVCDTGETTTARPLKLGATNGTVVIDGVANFSTASANADKIYLFSNAYGLGIDATDTVIFGSSSGGTSIKTNSNSGTLLARFTTTGLEVAGAFGVNGAGAVAKPTVTGSRGGNAALASVLTALASYGLITDSSS